MIVCLVALGACSGEAGVSDGGTTPPEVTVPSEALIRKAIEEGRISAEQGLIYRVFAAFGDQRLPAEFRGAGGPCSTGLLVEVNRRLASLSAETQATLAPFLLPPSAPGSWLELPSAAAATGGGAPSQGASGAVGWRSDGLTVQWSKVRALGGKVIVWSEDRYPGEDAIARSIAAELDARLWRTIFEAPLAMRKPLPDDGADHTGGDGALDIFLVHLGTGGDYGVTKPSLFNGEALGCSEPTPVSLQINTQLAVGRSLFPTVAHELMHASQMRYKADYCAAVWWAEANGTWAEDYAYPPNQTELKYVDSMLNDATEPLDDNRGDHPYGAFLFPLFVQKRSGKPEFVQRSWELAESSTILTAIDSALTEVGQGGWKDAWPEFVKSSWNREPVQDLVAWDAVTRGVTYVSEPKIMGQVTNYPVTTNIGYLAALHYRFQVADPAIRRLQIDFPLADAMVPGAHVWLIPMIDGEYQQPERLGVQKKYCRDRVSENVSEFVLLISNSEWKDPSYQLQDQMVLISTELTGCQGYSGAADRVFEFESGAGPVTLTYRVTAGFEDDPAEGEGVSSLKALAWSFDALYDLKRQRRPCRTTQRASGTFAPKPMGLGDSGQLIAMPGTNSYFWFINLVNDAVVTEVSNCNDNHVDVTTMSAFTPAVLGGLPPVAFDMAGNAVGKVTDPTGTTTWNFVRTR